MGPIWTGKNAFAKVFVFPKIFAKKQNISLVNDYADIVRVVLVSADTLCQCSQGLCWHMGYYFTLEKVKKLEKKVTKM